MWKEREYELQGAMSVGMKKSDGGVKRPKPDSSPGIEDPSIADMVKSLAQQMNIMNDNITGLRTEMNIELTRINEAMGNWQEEKKSILEKQAELESRLERLERQGRKKKVVISGMPEVKGEMTTSSAVNAMLKDKLASTVSVCDAYTIRMKSGHSKIIAEFRSMEDKISIMKNKKSLPQGIYVNDDLTPKDQHQRFKARELVRSKGAVAKDVKIRSGTVNIDGVLYVWDDEKSEYLSRKN